MGSPHDAGPLGRLLGRLCAAGLAVLAASGARALPLQVTTASLANGTAGVAYADGLQASSGTEPYTWSIASGSLPGGIVLDGASGGLSGTATLAQTSEFVVFVSDAVGDTASRALSITIVPAAASALGFVTGPSAVTSGATMTPPVTVKVADAFGNGVSGELVSLSLVGSGTLTGGGAVTSGTDGIAAFAGLSVDLAGSKQVTATSGALAPVTSAAFTVSCPAIGVAPATLPSGAQGVAYSQTLSGTGGVGPYTFAVTAGALPPGLTLGAAGGLAGTPTAGGSFGFTVTATDADQCAGSLATSIIVCAPFTVLPGGLPPAQPGVAYSQSLSTSGGVAPFTFALTAGALPPGLSLSGAGVLSGTPTATGSYAFTVTATAAGGCAGSTAYSLSVPGVPVAVSDLSAVRLTSGNGVSSTSRMQIAFTLPAFAVTAEVYRAPFGGYPRYDDAGGLTPATPSYPPGAPWTLTAVAASGQTDQPATRDTWFYVVFVKNALGQVSPVSNPTPGTPDYALGDVSDGVTAGAGDNLVDDRDISLLGAHYGISGATLLSAGVSYLDVGPTIDFSVTSRPFTDGRIDFEDLIVFATNYGAVSQPAALVAAADAMARAASGPEQLAVEAPALVAAGETFEAVVRMTAGGRVQGLSAELGWDAATVEPVGVSGAGWIESQHGVVWSAKPGTFDAALLGVRARGISGAGELARVTFRARAAGDPAIHLARVLARDAANRPLRDDALRFSTAEAPPTATALLAPAPNPARGSTAFVFALAEPGDVELALYGVDGRRVRTLAHGPFAAGTYRFTWAGDDEQHRAAAPGVYFAQLVTGGRRLSRTLVLLHMP